jgi:hypothetical protein
VAGRRERAATAGHADQHVGGGAHRAGHQHRLAVFAQRPASSGCPARTRGWRPCGARTTGAV